eukprot:4458460-Pleurochrysis_carterae.AAC.1
MRRSIQRNAGGNYMKLTNIYFRNHISVEAHVPPIEASFSSDVRALSREFMAAYSILVRPRSAPRKSVSRQYSPDTKNCMRRSHTIGCRNAIAEVQMNKYKKEQKMTDTSGASESQARE